MKRPWSLICLLLGASVPATTPAKTGETVLLVHGLGRGPGSLWLLGQALRREGYVVRAVSYPSQSAPVAELAEHALGPVFGDTIGPASNRESDRVHIVTHSLGAILVRHYLNQHGVPPRMGRVVMLAPPNGGSEIVDRLARRDFYRRLNGPAGIDLGTGAEQAPAALGPLPAGVEVGVVAGSFSWNPLFSALIPGPDDGKVSVARTHVAGEADHVVVPYSHTWLMNRAETLRQVAVFLREGRFTEPGMKKPRPEKGTRPKRQGTQRRLQKSEEPQ
jgi:triacylglycerol lipase